MPPSYRRPLSVQMIMILSVQYKKINRHGMIHILSKSNIPMLVFFVVNEPGPLNITFRSNMPITFFISEFTNRFY